MGDILSARNNNLDVFVKIKLMRDMFYIIPVLIIYVLNKINLHLRDYLSLFF